MTDKEKTIIDGVDVSDCRLLDNYSKSMCNGFRADTSGFHQGYCLQNPNCYFKQSARKDERIRELEEKLSQIGELCDKFCYKQLSERKKSEFEEIKLIAQGE